MIAPPDALCDSTFDDTGPNGCTGEVLRCELPASHVGEHTYVWVHGFVARWGDPRADAPKEPSP